MAFRCRQKMFTPSSYVIAVCEENIDDKGVFKKEYVSQSKSLPDLETFNLTSMLEAGVNLQEVESKVLSASVINAENVVRKYAKTETKKEN